MTEKQLVKKDTGELVSAPEMALTLADTLELGKVFAESGFFPGIQTKAQAVAKIFLGRELGLPPVTSLQQIYLVQGRLMLSGQLIASLINRSNRYRYEIVSHNETECKLQFYRDEKPAYLSAFTSQDAKRAGIDRADSGWAKYPRAMLFNRAISQGAKIVCPELLGGAETLEDAGYEEVEGQVVREGEPPHSEWQSFWGEAKILGFVDSDAVHDCLGVRSLKEWLESGKTLDDALTELRKTNEALNSAKVKKDMAELWGDEPPTGQPLPPKESGPQAPTEAVKAPVRPQSPAPTIEALPTKLNVPTQEELARAKAGADARIEAGKERAQAPAHTQIPASAAQLKEVRRLSESLNWSETELCTALNIEKYESLTARMANQVIDYLKGTGGKPVW
ncbi:MAG: hypothetical protein Q8K68_13160 [Nitrospirota bacterium]|nr:hypothetical protein [Nitrospirota bacterium]